jgi:serine/threonine protein kinase
MAAIGSIVGSADVTTSSIEPDAAEEFGPYLVYERLGMGGMATVHRAKKRGIAGFERGVALKRLLPHLAEDQEFIKSFVREAKLASMLVHPNIAQIYEFGRIGSAYYIAMEHVAGIDVRKILRYARRSGEVIPLPVALSIIAELCDALEYAHTYVDELGEHVGIVHRDVSPSNLIISYSGHLKVIDFGIAKATQPRHHTESGRIKGKLGYLSPEAALGKNYGPPSDVFSAGVVAFELLTTHPLFWAKTDYETLLKINHAEVPPPSRINPAVPPDLDKVVLQALQRSASDRTQSAGDLRVGIDRIASRFGFRLSSREVFDWLSGVSSESWATLRPAPRSLSQQQAAASASQLRPLPLPPPPEPALTTRSTSSGRLTSIAAAAAAADAGHVLGFGGGSTPLPRTAEDDLIAELAWGTDGQSYPLLDAMMATGTKSPSGSQPTVKIPEPARNLQHWGLPAGVAVLLMAIGAVFALRSPKAAPVLPPPQVPSVSPASPATLNFAVQPPDSRISIGGKVVTSATVQLAPGVYSISIQHEDYQAWSKDVTVSAGETQAIGVALERSVVSEAPQGEGNQAPDLSIAQPGDVEAVKRPHDGARAQPKLVAPPPRSGEVARTELDGERPGAQDGIGGGAGGGSAHNNHSLARPDAPLASAVIDAGMPVAKPPLTPDAAPARAPRVPTVSSSAVSKLSGTMPELHVRGGGGDLSDVVAKLCIDERGAVTSAQTVRAAKEIAGMVERELRSWRYTPYLAQGKPSPACFPVQMRVVVVSSN